MELFRKNFAEKQIRLLDHTNKSSIFNKPNNALLSFALEDAITTAVGEESSPMTVRLWVHDKTLVLGIPDSRLSYLQKGVEEMQRHHYNVIIRNSGGLAVLLDKNVLNISFVLPNKDELSINEGYDLMYDFTKMLFKEEEAPILAYEIKGSYCPGDYDLSIDGKKFAGISQRRVRKGVSVQMYLDIAGKSYERAALVKKFYSLSKGEEDRSFIYPDVNPTVMASLSELLHQDFSVEQIIGRIRNLLHSFSNRPLQSTLTERERELFFDRYKQMEKRNELIRSFYEK